MLPGQWLLSQIINIIWWIILVDIIFSWLIAFNVVNTNNKFIGTIADVADRLSTPILAPFRKIVPPISGLDISPIILILVLQMIERFVIPMIPF